MPPTALRSRQHLVALIALAATLGSAGSSRAAEGVLGVFFDPEATSLATGAPAESTVRAYVAVRGLSTFWDPLGIGAVGYTYVVSSGLGTPVSLNPSGAVDRDPTVLGYFFDYYGSCVHVSAQGVFLVDVIDIPVLTTGMHTIGFATAPATTMVCTCENPGGYCDDTTPLVSTIDSAVPTNSGSWSRVKALYGSQ